MATLTTTELDERGRFVDVDVWPRNVVEVHREPMSNETRRLTGVRRGFDSRDVRWVGTTKEVLYDDKALREFIRAHRDAHPGEMFAIRVEPDQAVPLSRRRRRLRWPFRRNRSGG